MSASLPRYGLVFVTAPTQDVAQAIARTLIQLRLAACVNIFPLQSFYTWEGKLEEGAEWQLLIKTDLNIFPILQAKVQEIHPYSVPEIIAIPLVDGSPDYLNWLGENVGSE